MKDLASRKSHAPLGRIPLPYPRRCASTFSQNEPTDLILVKTPKGVSITEICANLALGAIDITAIVVILQHASSDAQISLLIVAVGSCLLHMFVMVARSVIVAD